MGRSEARRTGRGPVLPSQSHSQTEITPDTPTILVVPRAAGGLTKDPITSCPYLSPFFAFQYNSSKGFPSPSSSTSPCLPHSSIQRYLGAIPSPANAVCILASTLQEVPWRRTPYRRPSPHTLLFGMLPFSAPSIPVSWGLSLLSPPLDSKQSEAGETLASFCIQAPGSACVFSLREGTNEYVHSSR